jgi:5-methylcytosine-specific restriction enzyme A
MPFRPPRHNAAQQQVYKLPRKSTKRYSRQWQRYAAALLVDNPVCLTIARDGKPCNQPATEVDHVDPVDDENDPRFWDVNNHRARCKSCHSRKTWREQRGLAVDF